MKHDLRGQLHLEVSEQVTLWALVTAVTNTQVTEVWELHDARCVYWFLAKELISKVIKWPVKYSKEFASRPNVKYSKEFASRPNVK
jgi:hypothetical protein